MKILLCDVQLNLWLLVAYFETLLAQLPLDQKILTIS